MDFGILVNPAIVNDASVAQIASAGFDAVEIGVESPIISENNFTNQDVRRVVASCASGGVRLRSVVMGWQMAPGSPLYGGLANSSVRGATVESLVDWLGVTRDLGAEVMLLPFFGIGDLRSEEALDSAKRGLGRISQVAQAKEVRLGIECALPAAQLLKVLDDVGSEAVGAYYDVGNAMCLGYDPVHELRELGETVVALHIKEFAPDDRWRPASTSPTPAEMAEEMRWLNTVYLGKGVLPVREILTYLHSVRFSQPVTLEMFPISLPDPIEAAIAGLQFLQEVDSLVSAEQP